MELKPFIITNAGNTCYIDSLLISLFAFNSNINTLLMKDPKDKNAIYLQEFIKFHFVEKVRSSISISFDTMNMIKELCFQIGWKNKDQYEIDSQQDVSEFYEFLMDKFDGTLIEIERETLWEDGTKTNGKEKIPFIPLSLPYSNQDNDLIFKSKSVSIKNMLHTWMYDNPVSIKKDLREIKGLSTYTVTNLPQIIPIAINRYNNNQNKIDTSVIIQRAINLYGDNNNIIMSGVRWHIHSIICHNGITSKNGHYYAIIYNDKDDQWFMFDDLATPCIWKISMKDPSIIKLIKKECVFVFYKLV